MLAASSAACGRSAEVAAFSIELTKIDNVTKFTYATWHQPKVARAKGVLFVPGNGRHKCMYNLLSDYLASGVFVNKDYTEQSGDALFWFPELQNLTDPGGAVGDFIKGMAANSAHEMYKSVCRHQKRSVCISS